MDQIEEVRRKIDIVELINAYVPLKKTGRNYKALCPFHSEKTPSFIVSSERQIWHCFGACADGGDIFKFLMKMENLDFGEALRDLAKRAGVKLISYRPSEGEKQKQLYYEINHLAAEYFHYLLLNHRAGKKALAYILGRGINRESLSLFKLGYSPDLWDGLLGYLAGKKGYRREDLEAIGLIIKSEQSGYYDRFRHRLMFPLKDHRGNIRGFAGRKIPPPAGSAPKGEENEGKYVNTPETLIYHKSDLLYGLSETYQEIKKADGLVLVEGELDAISSYQAGVKNVAALKGSALTENQIRLISRFTKNISFALDSDIAGDVAARRGIELADEAGLSLKVVEIKEGKDPDEVAQKNPLTWQQQVEQAVPIYDYFIDSAFARYDKNSAEGKRKIAEEVISILPKISNEIVRDHYLNKLAEGLAVAPEAVAAQTAKFKEATSSQKREADLSVSFPKPAESAGRREFLEEYLLALAFQSGRWEWLKNKKLQGLVTTPRLKGILEISLKYQEKFKEFKSERLSKMLPAELVDGFNHLYFVHTGELVEKEEAREKEFKRGLIQLEQINWREKLEKIAEEIKRQEKEKNQGNLSQLEEEFAKITKRLSTIASNSGKM